MRHNQVIRAGKRTAASVSRISSAFQHGAVFSVLMFAALVLGGCAGLVSGTTSNPPSPSTLVISNVQTTSTTTSTSKIVWTTKWNVRDYPESRRLYVYTKQPEYDGQWRQRHRGEFHGHTGICGADNHYAASESGGDRRSDRYLHGGRNRNGATELSMAEERGQHCGSDLSELHHGGNDDFGQRGKI